ncbi:MAG: Phosphomannomutase/phosphoglucomutase [Legionellaceae bacterium]
MSSYLEIPSVIPSSLFRAYDIRGIVGDTLTPDCVYAIALAIGHEAITRGETTIIAGCDGRISSPLLMDALCEGLLDSGCNVIDIGECPTPILYFATHTLASRSGIMVTGSHNPAEYNGLKMLIAGETLAEGDIQNLYQSLQKPSFEKRQRGIREEYDDIFNDYIAYVTKEINLEKPLKVVVDCGNGAAGYIAPDLFRALGCEVIELYCEVDGHFPNHHPDPSQQENLTDLIDAVLKNKADIGIAFDGDGDRIGVITDKGQIIWPDRQLILLAQDVLLREPGATIIYDVKCTRYLKAAIEEKNGNALMWKTGHSLIKNKMKETGAALAGEMSGHIFFKNRWFGFDDALYAATRLLEIIAGRTEKVSEIFDKIPNSVNTPELKLAVAEEKKFELMALIQEKAFFTGATVNAIDGLRVDYPHGWGLIRPSNTTPYLVLRFEAENVKGLKQIQAIFREQLLKIEPRLILPF